MTDTQDIRRRTVRGLSWTASSTLGQQVLQFGFTAVLARLIVPRDFGLIAMIGVFSGFATLFVDLGLGSAIVQRPKIEERHLSSAFWVNLAMGAGATVVIMALAPAIAAFFGQPQLVALTLAIAPTFLFASLAGVQTALLERELDFRRLVVVENVAFIAGNVVAILMALRNLGVWSFIGLALVASVVRSGLLFVKGGWRPRLFPDRLSVQSSGRSVAI